MNEPAAGGFFILRFSSPGADPADPGPSAFLRMQYHWPPRYLHLFHQPWLCCVRLRRVAPLPQLLIDFEYKQTIGDPARQPPCRSHSRHPKSRRLIAQPAIEITSRIHHRDDAHATVFDQIDDAPMRFDELAEATPFPGIRKSLAFGSKSDRTKAASQSVLAGMMKPRSGQISDGPLSSSMLPSGSKRYSDGPSPSAP